MSAEPLGEALAARAAPVLDFFRARLRLPPILLDPGLAEDALCTRAAVLLHPRIAAGPALLPVLAHELFHAWSRGAVAPARWGALPRLVPLFAAERSAALASLAAANVEEIAADLLTARLCARLAAPFHPAYLAELPADLVEARLARARQALAAPLRPAPPSTAAELEQELAALAAPREALRRLSGFELAALAIHELRTGAGCPHGGWPAPLAAALPAELQALRAALEALDAPRMLAALCAAFGRPATAGFAHGPLWSGASPLEHGGRELARRLRDRGAREELREALAAAAARAAAL